MNRLGTADAKTLFEKMGWEWKPGWLGARVEPIKARRSTDQNALYWVIISALASEVGMSKAEMHNEVLAEFHGFDLVEFRGSIVKRPKGRSHNLKTEDFSNLMLIAERWCAEMGVNWDKEV